MKDEFTHNVLRHGEKGKTWLKSIPDIIATYEKKWSLQVLPPYTLSYNYVAPVVLHDGSKGVIKIGMPWEKEFLNEIQALQVFNGDGVTRLLKADKENYVMLLEQVQPGIPLSTMNDDDKATQILASIILTMQKPLPKESSFITIYSWTRELREYPQKTMHKIPLEITKEGIVLFDYLLSTSQPSVLTHGDLHHDNVLSSGKNNWLAIDPKGIAAEPLYDVAALIRNPYKKIKIMTNEELKKLFTKRMQILSSKLHADPKRIQKWCLAQTILSGIWSSDTPEYVKHSLRMIGLLEKIEL